MAYSPPRGDLATMQQRGLATMQQWGLATMQQWVFPSFEPTLSLTAFPSRPTSYVANYGFIRLPATSHSEVCLYAGIACDLVGFST